MNFSHNLSRRRRYNWHGEIDFQYDTATFVIIKNRRSLDMLCFAVQILIT